MHLCRASHCAIHSPFGALTDCCTNVLPCRYATLTAWSKTLLLFGGSSSIYGDMHNSTFEFSTTQSVWQQVLALVLA